MDLQLRGKRALVTGSTAGIGYAAAAGLFREGASVVVNGRTPQRVDEAVGKLRGLGGEGDVSGVAEAPDADWPRFFEVKVMSGARLTRHYLPRMRRRDWGRIMFVASESGVQVPVEMVHYGMTKTAQLAISRGVAGSVAGTGITVNSALPGPTESEGVATFVADLARRRGVERSVVEAEFFQASRPSSLIKRFATVDEVADMIVYVCSPLASATNGAGLRVDGGVVRSIV